MSSILTNNGAMVALQTLKSINSRLTDTQNAISTGKSVGTARDNAAVWAISKVMESDVKGFQGISDSLNLGESTVAVARNGAETVTDLLTEMKGKIVASQEQNVDRAKIQTDIIALRDQINAVVGAAQFNGLNLLSNRETDAGSGTVNVLASLDRSSSGVSASDIAVGKKDLGTTASSVTGGTVANLTAAATLNATQTASLAVTAPTGAGQIFSLGLTGTDANGDNFAPADYTTGTTAADAQKIMYIARDGDTAGDVAKGLAQAFAIYAAEQGLDTDVFNVTASGSSLSIASSVTDGTDTIAARIDTLTSPTEVTIGGGLERLNDIDVTTDSGADAALVAIEFMIQNAIDSAASFGSAQGRIETQSNFISSLTDSLKSGIGTLVDADMEEASARLQALQVQQQLGVQALSIANQAPQSLLSLFR
ncbi:MULTISPECIES: flagellin [Marivita]|uniref:Flagellin n=1 Tax=Marivita cryptomonadis TaxID=505252 RepID=A0A9Q2RZX4_9RHOB|nr:MULTISPECIES: flagellin [Marivita]MCR9167639.1 flagellin [Paracoccaceae bacterium]MBM2322021.1 flagellin [Marivita cryptomonadis]MBM2331352.1 flagellin [Marivita cryptomonadis]MBM2340938.1 flagellin [Marivita cryptomonadis]MBM2345600.1 flagellin [Marivita cryptomonadis]